MAVSSHGIARDAYEQMPGLRRARSADRGGAVLPERQMADAGFGKKLTSSCKPCSPYPARRTG